MTNLTKLKHLKDCLGLSQNMCIEKMENKRKAFKCFVYINIKYLILFSSINYQKTEKSILHISKVK